jgi:hypothetical protein
MTIFDLDRYVVGEYERFARSFTTIRAGDLRDKLNQADASNRFWPEPMIQLNPRFKGGGTVGQLVRSGDLAAGIDKIFGRANRSQAGTARSPCTSTNLTPSRSPTKARASSLRPAPAQASRSVTSSPSSTVSSERRPPASPSAHVPSSSIQ